MKLNIDKRHLLLNSQEPTTLKIGDYPPLKKVAENISNEILKYLVIF